jgi:MoCo/4Fe-4S cofactor protein with predicted Tat translocation signal
MSDVDLSALRDRLAKASGPTYWRSLEELADSDAFRHAIAREFPAHASELTDPSGRRDFLKLMGASMALAGVTACTRQPEEAIVPYVKAPEQLVPGNPLFFATALPHGGYATPVLVESHEGRPTKVEPNPEHPATRGGSDIFAQASVLTLYDPDRSRTLTYRGEIRPWSDFVTAIQGIVAGQRALGGAGLRILTETVTSPTLAAQIQQVLADLPGAKWVQWDPLSRDSARAGTRAAFGQDVDVRYRFDQADVIVSLDADLLDSGPGRLRYARDFVDRRRLLGGERSMNRLYVVESRLTNTGAMADHRLRARASDVEAIARAIASAVGVAGGAALPHGVNDAWIRAVAADLTAHRGRALVVAGDQQPPVVHHLAHLMNAALGSLGTAVEVTAPVEAAPQEQLAALRELAGEMSAGKVDALIIIGANPVYTAPADMQFARRMEKVQTRVHVGLFDDETAQYCHWHVPETHTLETWSDLRAFDGTVTICQPLIAPLYDACKSAHEVFATLTRNPSQSAADIVKGAWQKEFGAPSGKLGPLTDAEGQAFGSFDLFWRQALHDGFVAGSAFTPTGATPTGTVPPSAASVPHDALEVTFAADPTVYDGRFATNAWLQECPKPFSKMVWENAIVMSPATARTLGFEKQDLIEHWTGVGTLTLKGRSLTGPIWVQEGHPDGSINVQLGYGRTRAGRIANGIGYNAYALRASDGFWFAPGAKLATTGDFHRIASTQTHFNMEGRNLVRSTGLAHFQEEPAFAQHLEHVPPRDTTLHGNKWSYTDHAWGMTIDLNACIGCNACIVACVAENNIPVVGKDQVRRGREMHWIRVDRYYSESVDDPRIDTQPVTCMQCENAPCEVVCPVAATVHSSEGLNDMVYNRCVGTRYCQNNCPYKVRRFNFYLYQDWDTPSLKMVRNPDVSVRSRGVMEKCTYCVQRINRAKIQAQLEDRRVKDGEIVTSCEAACPTRAITFGDVNDAGSRVAALKKEPRNYGLLEDLNTRPRTTYLASVRNPNPALHGPRGHDTGH